MPAVRTRLFGWSPSSGNELNVEVSPSQRPFSGVFIPQPPAFSCNSINSDTHLTDKASRPSTAIPTPSEPSFDTPSPPTTSPSIQAARSGSPDHIRRPRNSFIIFRCQFSREHSKTRSQDAGDLVTDKSVSKRASEAWAKLTKEEKKVYEDMATLEKEEHARLNPDYRFKPKKRQPDSKRRKPFRIPSLVGLRRRTTSASVSPSQARVSRPVTPSPSLSPLLEAVSSLPASTETPPSPSLHPELIALPKVDPAIKAARRRSASAPQPYNPLAAPPIYGVYPTLERQEIHQRSRSIVARPVTLPHTRIEYTRKERPTIGVVPRPIPPSFSTPELSVGYDGRSPFYLQPQSDFVSYSSSAEELYPSSQETELPSAPQPRFISPLAAVATTLSGWNSDFTATPSTTPLAPSSPVDGHTQQWQAASSSPPDPGASAQSQGTPFTSIDNPNISPVIQNPYLYPFDDPTAKFLSPHDHHTDTESSPYSTLVQPGPPAYQEADCSQALQEYGLGLSERLGSGSPFFFTASSPELSGVYPNGLFDYDLNTLFPFSESY